MRALLAKHAKAIELRKMGWSYLAIKQELHVAKSSLSMWLHNYPLSEKQIRKLKTGCEARRVECFRQTFAKKRQEVLDRIYQEELDRLLPITEREMYLAGLMLYWGEGLKATWGRVSFSNTNPTMIRFAKNWLIKCCDIPIEKIHIRFHFYSDMVVKKEHTYWHKFLDLPIPQFGKPYIKQSLRADIMEKGGFGHGTCDLTVYNTLLKEKIMMGIKVVADIFSSSDKILTSGR